MQRDELQSGRKEGRMFVGEDEWERCVGRGVQKGEIEQCKYRCGGPEEEVTELESCGPSEAEAKRGK